MTMTMFITKECQKSTLIIPDRMTRLRYDICAVYSVRLTTFSQGFIPLNPGMQTLQSLHTK